MSESKPGVKIELDETNPPRIRSIGGIVLPEGTIFSPNTGPPEYLTLSPEAVDVVDAAYRWRAESRRLADEQKRQAGAEE